MNASPGSTTPEQSPLASFERSAWRYDTQDGVLEMLAGGLFLVVGVAVVDPRRAWAPALMLFPLRFLAKVLKERYTYPRIGYVRLQGEGGDDFIRGMMTHLLVVVGVLAVGLWLFDDITSFASWRRWIPALASGFTAGAFIFLAQKSALTRYWLLAAGCLVWGVACAGWFPGEGMEGMQRWAFGFGGTCFVVGIIVFARFLATHPVLHEGGAR